MLTCSHKALIFSPVEAVSVSCIVMMTGLFFSYVYKWLCIFSVATSISFNQSTYIVNENDRLVQVVLVLNKTVASNITVRVRTDDNTATGKHAKSIHKTLLVIILILQKEVLIIILDHTL